MIKCLEKLIQEKNKDQHDREVYLSKNYDEYLLYTDIIEKMNISQHYRILQMAIKNYQYNNFPYDLFTSFLISQLEKGMKDFSILMTLVDIKKINREDLLKIAKLTNFDGSPFKIPNYYIFECICTDKQETEKNIDTITTVINSSLTEIKKQLNEIINQRNVFHKVLDDIKSDISDIQNKQNLLQSKISKVDKNIKSKIPEINENINSKISEIISMQKKFNDENKDFIQKQISDSQDKNKEFLISSINELKSKIKDTQTKSNNLILSKAEENKKSIDFQMTLKIKFHLLFIVHHITKLIMFLIS